MAHAARPLGWTLVREKTIQRGQKSVRPDGALVDLFQISRGWYEAKGPGADLAAAARAKFEAGYPRENMLFWQPGRILLAQGAATAEFDAGTPEGLAAAVCRFLEHREPVHERWEEAVRVFKDRVPELAQGVLALIRREQSAGPRFKRAFEDFATLCRAALNPNLSTAAVEEMLLQHLLTERIFRKVFDNPDFVRRNVIAAEIEKVIDALTSRQFSRQEFLKSLDPFYGAIEETAAGIEDWSEKQGFLNTVYEQFFQGFSVKVADTHGIVYTPQPIVDFMVESVEELLAREFGTSLADAGVHVLDPFVGTGNFLVRVLRKIAERRLSALPAKFAGELHANEVMLLPYYIASLNLEHAFYELTGNYQPFDGLCLVDTFELAEEAQGALFTEENTERVERQRRAPIRVVIGNPPYNVGQKKENDNNKNRKYRVLDRRIRETYGAASNASSLISLGDPYIRAIRWATDRIAEEGIVAFVCNSNFLDGIATDGLRKHLAGDFDRLYILDLGGNVRKNPKISGTSHNVFGIKVGVSINFLVRRREREPAAVVLYAKVPEDWRKEVKWNYLVEKGKASEVAWSPLVPDERYNWLTEGLRDEFRDFLPLATEKGLTQAVFGLHTVGLKTNRDAWAYNFSREALAANMRRMIEVYNDHVRRWPLAKREKQQIDDWVEQDDSKIAWSRDLKLDVDRGKRAEFEEVALRSAFYRPFTRSHLYYSRIFTEEPRRFGEMYLAEDRHHGAAGIWVKTGQEWPFFALASRCLVDNLPQGGSQFFPHQTLSSDGLPQDNITDWALALFRSHYPAPSPSSPLSKLDIFHYVYAVLHHPTYRTRYAANLRRELPRVPLAPDFWGFARAGARLVALHADYESAPEFPLTERWTPGAGLDWRVERMKYDPAKGEIRYNAALTLTGIPLEVERYRLGHKSAIGWVVDQYRVSTDPRSGIVNDPNRADDPRAIVRLIRQVVHVSVETVKEVESLPELGVG